MLGLMLLLSGLGLLIGLTWAVHASTGMGADHQYFIDAPGVFYRFLPLAMVYICVWVGIAAFHIIRWCMAWEPLLVRMAG